MNDGLRTSHLIPASDVDAIRDELAQEEHRLEQQLRAPHEGRLADEQAWRRSMGRRRERIRVLREQLGETA